MRTTLPMRLTGAALAAGLLSLAACGGDDEAAAGFCQPQLEVGRMQVAVGAPGPESNLALAQSLQPLLGGVVANAPEPVAEAAVTAKTTVDQVVAGGDPMILDGESFGRATGSIGDYAFEHCGFRKIELEAADFRFDGLPRRIEAGPTSIRLQNKGGEPHLVVIVRRRDGVTAPLEELLAAGAQNPGAAADLVEDVAAGGFALPGTTGVLSADLAPGRYVFICPIPMGGSAEGAPHFMAGMAAELEVT